MAMLNGQWVPPLKAYNIYFNGIRVWSGDTFPPTGMLDLMSRSVAHANAMLHNYPDAPSDFGWNFKDGEHRPISY